MQPHTTRIVQALEHAAQQTNFSGVVFLKRHGHIAFEKAYGFADRSNRIPNIIDTRFGLASGSKFFTALGIGKLLETGVLSLSSRLVECVQSDFPNLSKDVTIGHLLTHTSGVYDYWDEERVEDNENFRVDIPWYELHGPKDYIPLLRQGSMKFTPGQRFSYSNSGYILLGIVIEDVTGIPYADFVQERIFEACGMHDSGYFAMNRLPARTALGYIEEDQGWRANIFDLPIIGASDGGAFSTARDLHKLWMAFFDEHILSREMMTIFLAKAVSAEAKLGPDMFYGHGIWIYHAGAKAPLYFILGSDAGVSCLSQCSGSGETLLTIISNTTDGAWPMRRAVDTMLWEDVR